MLGIVDITLWLPSLCLSVYSGPGRDCTKQMAASPMAFSLAMAADGMRVWETTGVRLECVPLGTFVPSSYG